MVEDTRRDSTTRGQASCVQGCFQISGRYPSQESPLLGKLVIDRHRTTDILLHLATRPGHDEVKAGFRELLIEEFGVDREDLEFERRVPEIKGRLDALIGRTIFEAKSNLDKEWGDVVRRMPDYLSDRERAEQEQFVGIASDGSKWVIFERKGGDLVKIKETTLDPGKPEIFLAWLDGAVALKSSLSPEPLIIRAELGQESVAFRRAMAALRGLWQELKTDPAVALKRQLWESLLKLVYGKEVENEELWFQHISGDRREGYWDCSIGRAGGRS
jgi:hypothetical protein